MWCKFQPPRQTQERSRNVKKEATTKTKKAKTKRETTKQDEEKKKNACAKRAKLLFFILKSATLLHSWAPLWVSPWYETFISQVKLACWQAKSVNDEKTNWHFSAAQNQTSRSWWLTEQTTKIILFISSIFYQLNLTNTRGFPLDIRNNRVTTVTFCFDFVLSHFSQLNHTQVPSARSKQPMVWIETTANPVVKGWDCPNDDTLPMHKGLARPSDRCPPLFWLHNKQNNYCTLLKASKSKLLVTIKDHKKDNHWGHCHFLYRTKTFQKSPEDGCFSRSSHSKGFLCLRSQWCRPGIQAAWL